VEAELVFRQGTPPQATFSFKHALVRDVAYETLLKSRRQQLHGRIAGVLRERFPEVIEGKPELMARHCAEAGLAQEAIQYLTKAGRHALERSANAEAVGHLSKGLTLLETLPAGRERDSVELDLLVALGAPLVATKGFTDPEVERIYLRARAAKTVSAWGIVWTSPLARNCARLCRICESPFSTSCCWTSAQPHHRHPVARQ
jgi:predicted ATPase